jgi:transposase
VIALGPKVRAYALCAAVDMRRGFEGLYGLATQELGRDVLAGDLFLFVGRDCKRAKVLYFDGTGLCILHKRLCRGRFAALWRDGHDKELVLSRTELELYLQGCQVVGRIPLTPAPLCTSDLVRRPSKSPPT